MAFEFLSRALTARRQDNLLRRRVCIEASQDVMIEVDGQHYLNFSSNDYLGLRQHPDVLQSWVNGLAVYGGGSGASPLVTGYTKAHRELEEDLAGALQREAVMLFNSGFAANQAVCQALLPAGTSVVADKLVHASFLDGVGASKASCLRFRHNDMHHAQARLEQAKGDTLLVSESVFSMDGDQAPVTELAALAQRHSAWLMLDDAHGFGVLGDGGFGVAQQYALDQAQLPVLMGTFGKALGTSGAFVAGSGELIEYLLNFSRHYVYSTHMPPAQALATRNALAIMHAGEQRAALHNNIAYFRGRAQAAQLKLLPSSSAIQPLLVGEPSRAVAMSNALKTLGIWINAIRSPTVPQGTDRLRITLTAAHQKRDLDALIDALELVRDRQAETP